MGASNAKVGPARSTVIAYMDVPNGAGAAALLPDVKGHSHVVKVVAPAGQTVYLGRAADIASVSTTVKTYPLVNGEGLVLECLNTNEFCVFGDAINAKLAIIHTSF